MNVELRRCFSGESLDTLSPELFHGAQEQPLRVQVNVMHYGFG